MSVTNQLISVLSILSCLGMSHADTLIVPDQYGTIQSAIDAAQEGDEVVIQPGIYNETFNYNGKGITVRSSEGPLIDKSVLVLGGAKLDAGQSAPP